MISKRCKNTGEIPSENRKWKAFIFHLFPRSSYTRTISLKLYTFFLPSSSSPQPREERERKICIHSLSPIPSYPRSTRSPESPSNRPAAESIGRWPCSARTSRSSSGTRWPTRFSAGSRCTAISRSLKHESAIFLKRESTIFEMFRSRVRVLQKY